MFHANKDTVWVHRALDDDRKKFTSGRLNVASCERGTSTSAPVKPAETSNWLRRTVLRERTPSGALVPIGRGERLLYLDYDGVLHHENVLWHPRKGAYAGPPGFVLFEHAALLDDLLKPYPDVGIVLSTSWVRIYGCYGAAKRLPTSLRYRVVGATFHSQMNEQSFVEQSRGHQVLKDVARRRPLNWLALDDTDEGWPPELREHLLLTDEQLGIGAPGMPERIGAALSRLMATSA